MRKVEDIEDDVKRLRRYAESCKKGISLYNPQEEGEALERILIEREQDKVQIQKLEKENKTLKNFTSSIFNGKDITQIYIPKQAVIDLMENETINISGFECIAVEDLQELLEGEK